MAPSDFETAEGAFAAPAMTLGETVMTFISSQVPEQGSRFTSAVMGVLTTAMIVVAGFILVATQFAAA
jgi:hypothetical protein